MEFDARLTDVGVIGLYNDALLPARGSTMRHIPPPPPLDLTQLAGGGNRRESEKTPNAVASVVWSPISMPLNHLVNCPFSGMTVILTLQELQLYIWSLHNMMI